MAVCKIITAEEDVYALAPAWRALHEKIGPICFTDYDWAITWWETVGKPEGQKLVVVTCHEDDRLVGVLPFSIQYKKGIKILRVLAHDTFYFIKFLAEADEYKDLMWKAIFEAKNLYDFAYIKHIHEGTVEEGCFKKQGAVCAQEHHSFYRALNGLTRQEYLASQTHHFRYRYEKSRKALFALKGLEFHLIHEGPIPEAVMAFLINRKKEWAVANNKRGIFDAENVAEYYHRIANLGAAKKSLYLNWLTLDGEVVAVALNFTEKRLFCGHTFAYHPKIAKYRPGICLCMEMIYWSSEHGMDEINFMEGNETYKQRILRTSRIVKDYMYAVTLRGRLYMLLYQGMQHALSLHCRIKAALKGKSCESAT